MDDKINAECVGPSSESAGKANSCVGCPNQNACATGKGKSDNDDPSMASMIEKMALIKHKVLVLSGKGGVGKSTFSAQLAFTLAQQGYQVGLLDIDICGPSIPRMLGLVGQEVHQSASGWSPVYVDDNLAVMSIGFMLPTSDDAIIWRGPRKNGLIKQFLSDVVWNDLDYLIVDTPPGTSDEHISIVQYLKSASIDGAVVVTTPQEVSMADVRKELNFCKKTGLRVLGIVENMSDILLQFPTDLNISSPNAAQLVDRHGNNITQSILKRIRENCPDICIEDLFVQSPLFKVPGVDHNNTPAGMAEKFNVPFLGRLPMDPNLMRACDEGKSFLENFPESPASKAFSEIVGKIVEATE